MEEQEGVRAGREDEDVTYGREGSPARMGTEGGPEGHLEWEKSTPERRVRGGGRVRLISTVPESRR